MARGRQQALAAAVAGAGIALCGCGAGAAPAASASSPATVAGTTGGGFCADATNFMRHIPPAPTLKQLSTASARANMATVLTFTVKGYRGLEKQSPATLRKPIRKIVDIYAGDEKAVRTANDMATVSELITRGNNRGAKSFQAVLRYLADHCETQK